MAIGHEIGLEIHCVKYHHTLDKSFKQFDNRLISWLVKGITVDMQVQYRNWWFGELTRDLIPAKCLDNWEITT